MRVQVIGIQSGQFTGNDGQPVEFANIFFNAPMAKSTRVGDITEGFSSMKMRAPTDVVKSLSGSKFPFIADLVTQNEMTGFGKMRETLIAVNPVKSA